MDVQEMDMEMVTVVHAIEALLLVTVFSPLAMSSKNKPGYCTVLD